MLKLLEGPPGNVVGFEAMGKVEADDYRALLQPAVEAAIEAHGSVRLLYVLGDAYDGFSAGAMSQDSRLGFAEREHFERIAVVSDHERLTVALGHFGWMFPGELRTFGLDQLEGARTWLSEAAGQACAGPAADSRDARDCPVRRRHNVAPTLMERLEPAGEEGT